MFTNYDCFYFAVSEVHQHGPTQRNEICIYDMRAGGGPFNSLQPVGRMTASEGDGDAVLAIAMFDERESGLFVTAQQQGDVRIWDVRSPTKVARLGQRTAGGEVKAHQGNCYSCSARDQMILTSGSDIAYWRDSRAAPARQPAPGSSRQRVQTRPLARQGLPHAGLN